MDKDIKIIKGIFNINNIKKIKGNYFIISNQNNYFYGYLDELKKQEFCF